MSALAALAALLGIAAIPPVSSSAYPKTPARHCPENDPKCATVIVHEVFHPVSKTGAAAPRSNEHGCLLITNDQAQRSRITREHKLRVAPGSYEIAAIPGGPDELPCEEGHVCVEKEVTVSAGQTREVTLEYHGK